MTTYPIKPVESVRTAADMSAADKDGIEGRWLDVPRLQQKNDEQQSNYWCGRTSAAMVVSYYAKFAEKPDEMIGHDDGPAGVGTNGQKKNLRWLGGGKKGTLAGVNGEGRCWPEGAFRAMEWKTDSGDSVQNLQGIKPNDNAYVEKVFKRHLEQLKKNNPVVQYTQLTKNKGHIVVVCGYRRTPRAACGCASTIRAGRTRI